jgi:hypothetical protein
MRNFQEYTKFFGTKGLTSTSANYISNIAKEIIKTINVVDKLSFANVSVADFSNNSQEKFFIEKGISEEDFNNLEKNIEIKAKLNALISWFREAIKAREAQIESMERYDFQEWLENEKNITDVYFGKVMPVLPEEGYPHITIEEYIEQNFSVKEMTKYFYLQSICSTLGKFIHPDGVYANAKEDIKKRENTSYIKETTSSNILYSVSSSIPMEEIEAKFFALQDKQREWQKLYNEIKFNVEKAVQKYNDEQNAKKENYRSEVRKVEAEVAVIRGEYQKEFRAWKVDELNRLRSLKIIIPNDLNDIYQYVSAYGKQNK